MKPHAQRSGSGETDPLQLRVHRSAEEHTERLAYDADTVLQLQLHAWSDEAWGPVAEALAEYGWAVMRGWLFNRVIYREVKKTTGITLEECPREWLDEETIVSLAGETVAKALHEFKRVLQQGKWNAGRGASLATYFVGQCKFQFLNVYRNWLSSEKKHPRTALWDPTAAQGWGSSDPTAGTSLAAELLADMDPKAARVFQLKADGYTHQEIAEAIPEMTRRPWRIWSIERGRDGSGTGPADPPDAVVGGEVVARLLEGGQSPQNNPSGRAS